MPIDGDALRKVRPAEGLRQIPRRAYNEMMDLVQRDRAARLAGGDSARHYPRTPTTVTVRNASGQDADRYAVLEIDGVPITPDVSPGEFLGPRLAVDAFTPQARDKPVVILLEPIADGKVGLAVVSGAVQVLLDVGDDDDPLAAPVAGKTHLVTGTEGTARVLYPGVADADCPGLRWGYVLLQQAPDQGMLVQLIAKDYDGLTPVYSWLRVADDEESPPLGYDYRPGHGEPGNYPVLSEQNIDLVVSPITPLGPESPAVASDDGTAGEVHWDNPTNAEDSDDAYATVTLAPGQTSHYLVGTDFGFAVPDGETPRAVKVEVECHASGDGVHVAEVKLVKAGAVSGTGRASVADLPLADDYLEFGPYALSVWGLSLSEAEAEATGFGAAIRVCNHADQPRVVSVDHVRVTLYSGDELTEDTIVRVRRGRGDYYLTDHEPRWEIVQKDQLGTPIVAGGVTYYPGYLLRWDQESHAWVQVKDILLIDSSV